MFDDPVRCFFPREGGSGAGNTADSRDNEWGRVLYRCGISFNIIWREREAAIIPLTSLKGTGMEVAVFSFGEANGHFDAGSVNGTRYCNEIFPYVRLFRGV
ncbi:hypothetical protein TNCV_4485261 [Trichonephila clavipes]|nr:hypothetical protein TNCV_4485261 [Trichonephila clavipes]